MSGVKALDSTRGRFCGLEPETEATFFRLLSDALDAVLGLRDRLGSSASSVGVEVRDVADDMLPLRPLLLRVRRCSPVMAVWRG